MKQIIHTEHAPKGIGCYSQAILVNDILYLSGQIGLVPATMELAQGFDAQMHQVFNNIEAVIKAANGDLSMLVKLNIYVTDMNNFSLINQVMSLYFADQFPARAVIGVNNLPRGALVEVDGIAVIC